MARKKSQATNKERAKDKLRVAGALKGYKLRLDVTRAIHLVRFLMTVVFGLQAGTDALYP